MYSIESEVEFLRKLHSYMASGHKPFDINSALQNTLRALITIGEEVVKLKAAHKKCIK